MKRFALAALGAISLSACAEAPQQAATAAPSTPAVTESAAVPDAAAGPDARAIAAIASINPQVTVDKVGAAPIPGFREAIVGGQVVYVSDDGRYLFLSGSGGALYDTVAKANLSEQALGGMRTQLLAKIPKSERIVFAPENPTHTVTVFTDVACGYCRKMHSEIAEYNKQGIAVEYLAFPRMGIGSEDYKTMVSVWCADDRRQAMSAAKADQPVPSKTCKTTVDMQYDIGQRVGLAGTPMILNEDGVQVGGYVPPAALRESLDALAAERATPASEAPTAAADSAEGA
ncbi:MAG: DsbC family protein [Pseudomonadota bacterium]|nr:DsbC family protein [Pseudomonadota bacterium]